MKELLMLLILFLPAYVSSAAQNIYLKQIGVVKSAGISYAIIQLDGNLTSAPSCANGYSHQATFPIPDGDTFGELTYSTALSAVVAQKEVYMDYSGSTCGLWGTRPLVNRIDIRK